MAFCSPKLDQVSASKIIEESIRREERLIRLGTEFTLHSHKKMPCIPDKPNHVTPASQPSAEELEAAHAKLATLANVKHTEQLPAQVYSLPPTHNMDYGFWQGSATARNPMFQHSKGHCDVTRYAADYYALRGEHLFGSKGGGGGGGGATGGKAKADRSPVLCDAVPLGPVTRDAITHHASSSNSSGRYSSRVLSSSVWTLA